MHKPRALISTSRSPGDDDDSTLFSAEREMTALRAQSDVLFAAGDREDHSEIWDRIFHLEEVIARTPAATLAGAVIKLRRLADPEMGIEIGDNASDALSVRQALAVVEREIAEPEVIGFGEPERRP
jgi:hypothetical protein